MEQQKQIEQLVLTCIDTAKEMLKEYEVIIPFGIRCFTDSEDMKMNCPADQSPEGDTAEHIDKVVNELKNFVAAENVYATVVVTELESEGESAVGLQIETLDTAVLFVYPYSQKDDDWVIEEPIQTDQLLAKVF